MSSLLHVGDYVRLDRDQSLNDNIFDPLEYSVEVDSHLLVLCAKLLQTPLRGVVWLVKVKVVKIRGLIRDIVGRFLVDRKVCKMHKALRQGTFSSGILLGGHANKPFLK